MTPPPHNHQIHGRSSSALPSFTTDLRRHGLSKAQTCFFKILHIISVLPAADASKEQCLGHDEGNCENRGLDIDLNISLRPPAEIERFQHQPTADSENCVLEKNDRRKSELSVVEESKLAVEERPTGTEQSEISHVGDQSSGVDYNGGSEEVVEAEKPKDEGYLGLLIEAAELILGESQADEKKPPPSQETEPTRRKPEAAAGRTKRKPQCWTAAAEAEWYAEFEDTSPVVRSKRGRSQVLPFKYRDSVVEPLVRWPSSSRHRSSNSNAAVPSRRRAK